MELLFYKYAEVNSHIIYLKKICSSVAYTLACSLTEENK